MSWTADDQPDDFCLGNPQRDAIWQATPAECQAYIHTLRRDIAELRAIADVAWSARFQHASTYQLLVLKAAHPYALKRLRGDWEQSRRTRGSDRRECSIYDLDTHIVERIFATACRSSAADAQVPPSAALPPPSRSAAFTSLVPDAPHCWRWPLPGQLRCRFTCRLIEALSWTSIAAFSVVVTSGDTASKGDSAGPLLRIALSSQLTSLQVLSLEAERYIDTATSVDARCAELACRAAAPSLRRLELRGSGDCQTTRAWLAALPALRHMTALALLGSFSLIGGAEGACSSGADDCGEAVRVGADSGLLQLLRTTTALRHLALRDVLDFSTKLVAQVARCSSLTSLLISGVKVGGDIADDLLQVYRRRMAGLDTSVVSFSSDWRQLLSSPTLRCVQLDGCNAATVAEQEDPIRLTQLRALSLVRVNVPSEREQLAPHVYERVFRCAPQLLDLRVVLPRGCRLQDGVTAALPLLTALTALELSGEAEGEVVTSARDVFHSCAHAFVRLGPALSPLTRLRELTLHQLTMRSSWLEKVLARTLPLCPSLVALRFVMCYPLAPLSFDVSDRPALAPVFECLPQCAALEAVELVETPVSAAEADVLGRVVGDCRALRSVALLQSGLDDAALAALRAAAAPLLVRCDL